MKIIRLLLLPCVVAALVFTAPSPLQAQRFGRGGNTKREPPKPQFRAIDSIDAAAHTVTISYVNTPAPQTKTYKLNDRTEIIVNGNRATLNDLKPGMMVSVGAGMDADILASITASPRPPDPTPVPKK